MYNNYTRKAYNLKPRSDECYTRAEDVSWIMDHLDLKDKLIWLPFDSDKSEFTKYCKKHELNFINTSDDYQNHKDLLDKCDIIVSNPPFSLISQIYNDFKQFGKDVVLIVPVLATSYACFFNGLKQKKIRFYNAKISKFNTPDGTIKMVNTLVLSNLTNLKLDKEVKHKSKYEKGNTTVSSKYKVFNDTMSFFESDIKKAWVPISVTNFDYFNKIRFIKIGWDLIKDNSQSKTKYYFVKFLVEKENLK